MVWHYLVLHLVPPLSLSVMALRSLGHILLTILLCLAYSPLLAQDESSGAPQEDVMRLLRISPRGEDVEQVRQIIFEFSKPVVPLGRMERTADEIPLTFDPQVECQWRWLSRNSLVCQLGKESALKLSTTYYLQLGVRPQEEEGLSIWRAVESYIREADAGDATRMKLCVTARPTVESVTFRRWRSAASPVLMVRFNQEVEQESVERALFFTTDGKRVKPRVVSGSDRVIEIEPEEDLAPDSRALLSVEPGIISKIGAELGGEERELLAFDTFGDFKFLGIRCCSKSAAQSNVAESTDCSYGKAIDILQTDQPDKRCDPRSFMSLLFSAPVIVDEVKKGLISQPDLAVGRTDYDPWETTGSYSRLYEPYKRGKTYSIDLPFGFKARDKYHFSAEKEAIKDEFGRPLATPLSFTFLTEDRAPRLAIPSRVGILEEQVATHLPVAVQNLDSLSLNYSTLTPLGEVQGQRQDITVDNIPNLSYYFPIKVRDLLGASSGVLTGSLSSTPKGEEKESSLLFTQVTPFHLHVKLGHHNSLIWVTDLAKGTPVAGAKVSLFTERADLYRSIFTPLSEGTTDRDGIAILKGTSTVDPRLQFDDRWWPTTDPIIKVRVDHQDRLAILPLLDDFKLYPSGEGDRWIDTEIRKAYGHLRAWGTTPQGVYRLGQVVQYKLYVRQQGIKRAELPPQTGYSLSVIDPLGKVVHSIKNITLNSYGGAQGEFKVPESGAVGIYQFKLTANFAQGEDSEAPLVLTPLEVLISDFIPAPFRVTTELDRKLYKEKDTVKVVTNATLHAGGPYGEAPVRVVAKALCHPLEDLDPKVASFEFDVCDDEGRYSFSVWEGTTTLDLKGRSDIEFIPTDLPISHGILTVESAVSDDRGGKISASQSAKIVSRDRFIGTRSPQWTYTAGRPIRLEMAVVDEKGRVSQGDPITGKIVRESVKASRVKGAGNAYITHYEEEEEEVASCDIAGTRGIESCSFTPKHPGLYYMRVTTTDSADRPHTSSQAFWVVGTGDVVWRRDNNHQVDLVPEKREYKVGQVAKFLIKNPFAGASALITVERFGVLKQWVQKLQGNTPVIEVKITEDMIPGFYLSAVIMSPRVTTEIKEGEVDLGKPAMRMGYAAVEVPDDSIRLKGTVKSDKATYRPGEIAEVDIQVEGKEQVELAVAVLDEAVFDLIKKGINYFDPYKGFFSLEALDLRNFNLLLELVGVRSFHKKGANSGGDGGGLTFRTITKHVAYWNPSLETDPRGKAKVSFPVPDNLTGWRVLALMMTRGDRMGIAEGTFKANRPLEIRAALPNGVHSGDSFTADFTIMSRTDKTVTLPVTIEVSGAAEPTQPVHHTLTAEPFSRTIVSARVTAKEEGEITFTVRAGDGDISDGLKVTLPVRSRVIAGIAAEYARIEGDKGGVPYLLPENIKDARSETSLSPTILTSLDLPLSYLERYPYSCWEQLLTRMVGAAQYTPLTPYIGDSFRWEDSKNFVITSLLRASSFQAPNGGMTFYVPRDENVDPYLSAYTALAFTWLKQLGFTVPQDVEEKLTHYLQRYLRENVTSSFYTPGMASTARAVALAALARGGSVTQDEVVRYIEFAPQMTLFGKAHLLQALTAFPETEKHRKSLIEALLGFAHEDGGKVQFQEDLDLSFYQIILGSQSRDTCAVLSAFLSEKAELRPSSDLIFKLARGIIEMRKEGRWRNTQENIFCLNSLLQYSKEFEHAPKGRWEIKDRDTQIGVASFSSPTDAPLLFRQEYTKEQFGKKGDVTITREGEGTVYLAHRLIYTPLSSAIKPANNGIDIKRSYAVKREGKWITLTSPYTVKRGELVKVTLMVSLPAPRNYVVVDDGVPGGLEPVNRDLGTASEVDAGEAGGEFETLGGVSWVDFATSRWSFYHRELRHDSVRFYSEQLSPGNYRMSYVAQAVAKGEFKVPAVHGEEMYEPDVFGHTGEEMLHVTE